MNLRNDCQKIESLLAPFVDGEIAPRERDHVEQHLQGCVVCASIVADFAATARLVATLPAPPALSSGFEAALARRIADQSLAPKPVSPWSKLGGRVQEWWHNAAPNGNRFAPAFAVAVTFLVIGLPTAWVLTGRDTGEAEPMATASTMPTTPMDVAGLVASDPVLAELYNEHRSFAAAQPLGDPAQSVSGEN